MFRIVPQTPIYRRRPGKRATAARLARQRQPRQRDRDHLARIAELPCAVPGCGRHPVHVAHLRYASAPDDAPLVGKGMKPDDWRVLPLCPAHHTEGPDAQHRMNEALFWAAHGINPYALARALFNLGGTVEELRFLVDRAPLIFPVRQDS